MIRAKCPHPILVDLGRFPPDLEARKILRKSPRKVLAKVFRRKVFQLSTRRAPKTDPVGDHLQTPWGTPFGSFGGPHLEPLGNPFGTTWGTPFGSLDGAPLDPPGNPLWTLDFIVQERCEQPRRRRRPWARWAVGPPKPVRPNTCTPHPLFIWNSGDP